MTPPARSAVRGAGYRGRVLRLLSSPKWIALTVLAVVLIAAFGVLSWWQWQRAQQDRTQEAPVATSQAFTGTTALGTEHYGARVQTSGSYDAQHQSLVAQGDGTYWVVTPLRPSTGPAVPVARGIVSDPAAARSLVPPAGSVAVVGVAQPFEGDPGAAASATPGQLERLTAAGLALPYPAVGGWVALDTQDPLSTLPPVSPPVSSAAGAGLRLQNASYAVQWVLFAAFVVFLWWRMLRDDAPGRRPALPAAAPPQQQRDVY
jgi:cytochrome oxidase assembly protein ShyY1